MKSLIIVMIFFSFNVHAAMVSAGSYVPYFSRAQINTSGKTKVFEINPYIGYGGQFHLAGNTHFLPELGYAYFLNNPENLRREQIFLHYNFSYIISDMFLLRYGITNNWYRLVGKGGSENLRNGSGSLSFPSPNKTVTSYYTTLNIGGEGFFGTKQMSVRFDLQVMSFQKLENKAYNYLLTLNFYRF